MKGKKKYSSHQRDVEEYTSIPPGIKPLRARFSSAKMLTTVICHRQNSQAKFTGKMDSSRHSQPHISNKQGRQAGGLRSIMV